MEQIYTIPVNEAFDEVAAKPECGCPFCVLYRRLQNDELDIILGASMMEPDIRIRTNEEGFCLSHYNMMLRRKRMLGMGLMLESHLAEVEKKVNGPTLLGNKAQASIAALEKLNGDCYVCGRVNRNLTRMLSNAVYMWENDPEFVKKVRNQKCICLEHLSLVLTAASKALPKSVYYSFDSGQTQISNCLH